MRVIWAIDPHDEEGRPDPESLRVLHTWSEAQGMNLLPVFVASSPYSPGDKEPELHPELRPQLRKECFQAREEVKAYLRRLELTATNEPKILLEKSTSLHRAARKLAEYAAEIGADLIVVSSHGRAGAERLLMGSFAERCLEHAPVPLLFLSRSAVARAEAARRIALFATDFSDHSAAAYRVFLKHAAANHSDVVLYHDLTLPMAAISAVSLAGGVSGISEEQRREQRQWVAAEAKRWVSEAQACGIMANAVYSENSPNVGASIVAAALKEGAELVALASHSRPLSALVLGSTAREVFRQGRIPVWVCGPGVLGRLEP